MSWSALHSNCHRDVLIYVHKATSILLCIGPVECPAFSCVWRSFWGSEVPLAHVWAVQVRLWQPCPDLPTQGSQGRAPKDPEVPHWRTWVWSKPERPGNYRPQNMSLPPVRVSIEWTFCAMNINYCVSCTHHWGLIEWGQYVTSTAVHDASMLLL